MTMIRVVIIGLFFSLFYNVSAEAKTCALDPINASNVISKASWIDQAQFSFYLGKNFNNRMVVQSRFDRFNSFEQLKLLAGKWPNNFRDGQQLSTLIIGMQNDVQTLLNICERLDASDFDGVPFNFAQTESELRAIRGRINAIMTRLTNYENSLKAYSSVVSAASQHYTARNFPTNPDLIIDPSAIAVASQLNDMQSRWRTIWADFRGIYTGVTVSVNPSNENDIINIADQAKMLHGLIEKTRSLGINSLPAAEFSKYASGNFLYENCPINDGQWYEIHNSYRKNHKLVDMVNEVRIIDTSSLEWLVTPPYFERGLRWKFTKNVYGYWKVQSELTAGNNKALNASSDKVVKTDALSSSGWTQYSGQFWRCYKTRWSNRYRFSSSQASEEKSLGYRSGDTGDITHMEPTAAVGGQLWILVPK